MNYLDLCLKVVSRSRHPLRYIWRRISRKPLELEVWFQRTTNRKWYMGYRMVRWPMTSRDLERSNSWPQYAYRSISRKLLELESSNLVRSLIWQCQAGAQIIFPGSGRGLGHVTLHFLAVRSAILATAWLLVKVWHCCVMNWWRYSSTSDVCYSLTLNHVKIPD